jgi:BirA family biotin operon repressor/biotin-[acetyl-CoA-carboxylase] ligase
MTARVKVLELGQIASTNSYLLERSGDLESGFTVFSTHQTSGRGRLGRQWHSQPGESLAVSCLLPAPPSGVSLSWVPLLAGVCAKRVLSARGAANVSVKWPNDVLLGPGKLAGILSEVAADGRVVVGMGLNVQSSAGAHSVPGAISLSEFGVSVSDLEEQVVEPWVSAMLDLLDEALHVPVSTVCGRWRALVESHLDTLGRTVRVQKSSTDQVTGLARGLTDDGGLIVSLDGSGEEIVIHSGDVFHIPRS